MDVSVSLLVCDRRFLRVRRSRNKERKTTTRKEHLSPLFSRTEKILASSSSGRVSCLAPEKHPLISSSASHPLLVKTTDHHHPCHDTRAGVSVDTTTESPLLLRPLLCLPLLRGLPDECDDGVDRPDDRRHVLRFLRMELRQHQLPPASHIVSPIVSHLLRVRGCLCHALAPDAEAWTLFDQSPDQDLPIRQCHCRKYLSSRVSDPFTHTS